MADSVDRYEILAKGDDPERIKLCPWTLRRDSRDIAHFTTRARAEDYRDYLIGRKETDE